jgi:hypothetical protein
MSGAHDLLDVSYIVEICLSHNTEECPIVDASEEVSFSSFPRAVSRTPAIGQDPKF